MAKIETLKNSPPKKKDGRAGNGGARDGAGAPKLVDLEAYKRMQQMIREHGIEEVSEVIEEKLVKKARALIVLDNLYRLAKQGDNVPAINGYLDRQVGKPQQTVTNNNYDKTPDLKKAANERSKQFAAPMTPEEEDLEDEDDD